MFLPNKDNIEKEIQHIKDNKPDTYDKIMYLYDSISNNIQIKNSYEYCNLILKDLFLADGYKVGEKSLDANIPLWFLGTIAGKMIFSVMYGNDNNVITVEEFLEMSKSPKKPGGYSRSWVFKYWDEGNGPLKGFKKGHQLFFYKSDAIEFLSKKGILK